MTNNISSAFRSVFKKKQNNGIKIISLGVGLAMGLVLIAKVCFEQSFDNFYPHSERIYQILETGASGDNNPVTFGQVSGGVAIIILSLSVFLGCDIIVPGIILLVVTQFLPDSHSKTGRWN